MWCPAGANGRSSGAVEAIYSRTLVMKTGQNLENSRKLRGGCIKRERQLKKTEMHLEDVLCVGVMIQPGATIMCQHSTNYFSNSKDYMNNRNQ